MRLTSYQPPIDCSHAASRKLKAIKGVSLRECKACGFVVGVIGPKIPASASEPEPFKPQMTYLGPPPSRFVLWLADQLDGLERALMPPQRVIDWWQEPV